MRDRWSGEEHREESKKGAGVDMKCEVLPSVISKHVSKLGAVSHFSDFTEQWNLSSRVIVELGIKSGSTAFGGSFSRFSFKSLGSLTEIRHGGKFDKKCLLVFS